MPQSRSRREPPPESNGSRVWVAGIAALVVLGIVVLLLSRGGGGTPAPEEPPVARQDHWHAAYGIYVCDRFLPPIQNPRDPRGIHTHNDGLIHIHPFSSSAGGRNATLGVFADAVDLELSSDRLEVPGQGSFTEGEDDCGGEPAEVVVKVDDRIVRDDFRGIRLRDRQSITIAFVPPGRVAQAPAPPTAGDIERLDPRTDTVRR
jgi:hypothetical protein